MVTEEVDQIVRRLVEKQAKRTGQKAMTAQAVGPESVLELLGAVFALAAAIIVEGEDGRSPDQLVTTKRKLVLAAECSAL